MRTPPIRNGRPYHLPLTHYLHTTPPLTGHKAASPVPGLLVCGPLTFSLSSDRERLSTLRHERICSCSSRENGWDRLLRNNSVERGRRRL